MQFEEKKSFFFLNLMQQLIDIKNKAKEQKTIDF